MRSEHQINYYYLTSGTRRLRRRTDSPYVVDIISGLDPVIESCMSPYTRAQCCIVYDSSSLEFVVVEELVL